MWWKLLRWIMAISVCTIMHQYAPFQVTKIGVLGKHVLSHASHLPSGCLDPWCLSATQRTIGGRKKTASYFQFGPPCPLPRMCSTWMWSARAQLPAFTANAWWRSWSVHISASAHARSSWTRTISSTNMHILVISLLNLECIVRVFVSSNCVNINN